MNQPIILLTYNKKLKEETLKTALGQDKEIKKESEMQCAGTGKIMPMFIYKPTSEVFFE